MIADFQHLLAESDPAARFIGIAVVVVIWIIGMIAQAVKKQQETKSAPPLPKPPPELAEGIRNRLPPVLNRPPRAPKQKRLTPQKQKGRPNWQAIAAPPPVPQEVRLQPVVQAIEGHVAAFKQAPPSPQDQPAVKKPFVDAAAVRRWLKPQTLQQQFILTELLQKPKCLREDDH